jgi:hypothetical protein
MSKRVLLAPAGWEERYTNGVLVDVNEFKPSQIIVPYSTKYSERTSPARQKIRQFAEKEGIKFFDYSVDYQDSVSLYRSVIDLFSKHFGACEAIRFNVTTSPRDMIWYVLHALSSQEVNAWISYYRPVGYGDWLSRDARPPRIALKRSGIAYPDRHTCILVLSGYDLERLSQLRQRYEPKKLLLGHQTGDQLDNNKRNVFSQFTMNEQDEKFNFDCYDTSDKAVSQLCSKFDELHEEYNVIAASLGPKPSAITLFKLTELRPEIGLVYIPAGDYNEFYSYGIDLSNPVLVRFK